MARQNMEKANLARDWVSYWVCSGISALLYCPSESTVPSTGYPSVSAQPRMVSSSACHASWFSFSSSFRSPPRVEIAAVSSVGRGPWNRKLSVRGSHQVTPRNRDHTRSSSDARRATRGCSPKSQSFSTVGGTGSLYVWQAATSSIAPKASQSGLSV